MPRDIGLFAPICLRGLTIRSRVVLSPMCQYAAEEGRAGDWHYIHHAKFAMGGVGIGFVEATAVTEGGRITHGCTGLWHDSQIAGLARIAELYRRFAVAPAIQLSHAGWKGSAAKPREGAGPLRAGAAGAPWETVGPSPLPCRDGWPACRELSLADIEDIKDAWRYAFRRARAAGYQIVEIHGAHGYLIHSFLSPLSNRRTDRYGGGLPGRMRLALEIAEIARDEWPAKWPVFFRVSAVDDAEGGWTLSDSVVLARELKGRGIDVIDCSSGGLNSVPPSGRNRLRQGFQVPLAAKIRDEAEIATMAVGLIVDPDFADAVVRNGDADLVAIGREFLVNPNWTFGAAMALGHDSPLELLPQDYAFFLARREHPKQL